MSGGDWDDYNGNEPPPTWWVLLMIGLALAILAFWAWLPWLSELVGAYR